MYRIDVPTAASSAPTPAALGTEGFWTSGNPSSGTPATIIDQDWMNALQENLIAILTAAGVAHSKTDYTRLLTAIQTLGRIKLTTATTFYFNASTGSDSNNGLSSSSPFATIQHAINVLQQKYDLNGQQVTISVAAGTYAPFVLGQPWVDGQSYYNSSLGAYVPPVSLVGDTTTPSNCIIHATTSGQNCVSLDHGAGLCIAGFKFTASSGSALSAQYRSNITVTGKVEFGTCSGDHMLSATNSEIIVLAGYTIIGAPPTIITVAVIRSSNARTWR